MILTGKEKRENNRKISRKNGDKGWLWIGASGLLLLIVLLWVFLINIGASVQRMQEHMDISLASEKIRVMDELDIHRLNISGAKESAEFFLNYATFYLQEYGISKSNLNTLGELFPTSVYYIADLPDDGEKIRVIASNSSSTLKLTDWEITQACSEGRLTKQQEDGPIYYDVNPIPHGYVMISYGIREESELGIKWLDTEESADGDIMFVIDQDRNIISGTDNRYVGKNLNDILTTVIEAKVPSVRLEGMDFGYWLEREAGDYTFASFVPVKIILEDAIRVAIVPMVLMCILAITIIFFAVRIRSEREEKELIKENVIVIFRKLRFDKDTVSHIVTLGLFGLILIAISIFYIHALVSYSDQNMEAGSSLKGLSESYQIGIENEENTKSVLEEEGRSYAELIARGYIGHTDSVNTEKVNAMVDKIGDAFDVTIMDGTGTIVASNYGSEGYTISRSGDSVFEMCWDILDGLDDHGELVEAYQEKDAYYVSAAVRRQDAKGIVLVEFDVDFLADMVNKWTLEEALLAADMGSATCFAIQNEEPGRVFVATPGAEQVEILDTSLNEEVWTNGYSGIQRIKGERFYLNTLDNPECGVTFISAFPISAIRYGVAWYSLISIVVCISMMLLFMIFYAAQIKMDAVIVEGESPEAERRFLNRDNLMNDRFKKVIFNMLVATGILLVLLLFLDYLMEDEPLLIYLFGSKWNKGINLLSITMILIIMVGSAVAGFLLNQLIRLVCNNMGPRGMTIGHLMGSLARFVILLVAIIWSLKEIGFNTSALLAGAGIAGAAISLCANSTVSDLLSGFFIVFEGAFQIGDWIQVGDWRGQVIEIGMRTTRIAKGDIVKIVNNATMTNIMVMDHMNSGALASVEVAYKEDVEKVIALLNDSRDRFREAIPEIQDGPYVKGVVDLGTNGVSIEMYAFGEQRYICRIERGIRLLAKKIFDENQIEIPFAQVTLHEAEPRIFGEETGKQNKEEASRKDEN